MTDYLAGLRDRNQLTLRTIVDLGHNLGMRVVAEGVETQQVHDALLAMNCDLAQGYYLSRPLPADTYRQWFEETTDHRRIVLRSTG